MDTKIAINGYGRIGRCLHRLLLAAKNPAVELVAVNDLTDAKTLAHLLKYDSVHGVLKDVEVRAEGDTIVAGGKSVPVLSKRDPAELPWKELGASIVVESTGAFTKLEGAQKHITAGAKRVIVSAPAKGTGVATFVMGVNDSQYDPAKHTVVSNASCTTNCLAPIAKVLDDVAGIECGQMLTVHAYTNDQRILDLPHSDLRRARAANLSMIPTTTGAARAVGLVLPHLKGKLDGFAIRVPTFDVSIVELVAKTKRATTPKEINDAMAKAAAGPMKGILRYCEEPIVSIDLRGDPHSAILDAELTMVIEGSLAKVCAWYDNEWAYSCRLLDLITLMAAKG